MTQTQEGRPHQDRPANHNINGPSLPPAPDNTVRCWTDADLATAVQTAWHLGYTTALSLAAQRVDDLDWLWRPIPRATPEERIAARHAEMKANADRAGLTDDDLARQRRRLDEATTAGARYTPITSWADIHAGVTPTVWARILGDLQPATREQAVNAVQHKTGAPARRLEAVA